MNREIEFKIELAICPHTHNPPQLGFLGFAKLNQHSPRKNLPRLAGLLDYALPETIAAFIAFILER